MKTSFEIIEEKIGKYKHLDKFNALIMGYIDYLNQDGQDEVLLLDAFLSQYFQPYSDDLFLRILVALFENEIGAGNDMANEKNFLKFPNETYFDKMLHLCKKHSSSIKHSNKHRSCFLRMIKNQTIEQYYNLVLFCGAKMYLKKCRGQKDDLTIFVHGTSSNPSTFTDEFKQAVAQTLKDENQKSFAWSGDNDVEARKQAGKELAQMIEEEIANLEEGEEITIIGHSHGGNVIKYASEELNQGELDNVVFLATPHREDARFNQKAVKQGGKVVNVYDGRDFVQGFWGKSDVKSPNPFSKKFEFKDLHLFAPNPKQTLPNAINIQVKPEKIEIPNYLPVFERDSYYNTSKGKNYVNSHTTIQNAKKWNESVTPIFRRK